MALLTANAQDQVTLSGLRRCGAVTVLVALLANESGAIQVCDKCLLEVTSTLVSIRVAHSL